MNKKDLNSAKTACFHLIKFRPRSEYELRSRLLRKGYDKEIIDLTIAELSRIGLIDDLAFAKLWVESRIKKPLGINRLYFELKIKGVDKDIIEQVINEYGSTQKEEEIVRDLLKQKLKRLANLDKKKIKNRLWGFFLRKGFSKDIVFDVLNELK
ncbi:MAG: regulatory protein RecX [Candidatus Omnitrophica bacterium]|nr:regulatory protein RecX [Candidatus Omnitrophota bacterium]